MKAPSTRYAYLVVSLVVAGYVLVTLHGPRGVGALFERQRQIQQMEQRNASLAREIEAKREHIRRLSDNPAEQELEIRDKLKLIRPDEKVYIIGESPKK